MKYKISGIVASAFLVGATPVMAQNIEDVLGGVAEALLTQEAEKRAFAAAQSANTVRAYRNYLEQFPNGANRRAAENAIERLGGRVVAPDNDRNNNNNNNSGVSTPASVEARLGLSRSQRTVIQRQLTAQGYNTGGADGLWGSRTRTALRQWQDSNNFPVTGYLTSEQFNLLYRGTNVSTPQLDAPMPGRVEEDLLGLTRSERREGQRRLTRLGYNTFGTDGVWGGNTRRALREWQRDQGEPNTGFMNADQWRELRIQAGF